MKNDETDLARPNEFEPVGGRGVLFCILCALPILLIVAHFAGLGRGRAAGLCTAVDILVMMLRWESKGKLWFWCAVSLILFVQVMAIVFIPFGDESMPAYALLPAALVIYLFDECIIFLFGRGSAARPK